MTRNWVYLCLRPSGDRPGMTGLPSLVDHLRTADPGGCWAFQRLTDHSGPHVGVWLYSRADVLHELGARARELTGDGSPPAPGGEQTPMGAHYLGDVAARTATALSHLSSDFALDMLAGGKLDDAGKFALTVAHVHRLAELVPARDRAGFLFQCWQYRAAGLSSDTRRILMAQARDDTAAMLETVAQQPWAPGHAATWERYLAALRDHAPTAGSADSPAYVIFDHAHLTHNRLGVEARVEALAAQVVRTALLNGLVVPALGAAALQPA